MLQDEIRALYKGFNKLGVIINPGLKSTAELLQDLQAIMPNEKEGHHKFNYLFNYTELLRYVPEMPKIIQNNC